MSTCFFYFCSLLICGWDASLGRWGRNGIYLQGLLCAVSRGGFSGSSKISTEKEVELKHCENARSQLCTFIKRPDWLDDEDP